jgi:hypothetical protein
MPSQIREHIIRLAVDSYSQLANQDTIFPGEKYGAASLKHAPGLCHL